MYLDNPGFKNKEMYPLIKIASSWICPTVKRLWGFFLFSTNPQAQLIILKPSFLLIKRPVMQCFQ